MAVICNNTGRVVSSVQYTSFSSDTAIMVQGRVGATRHPTPSLKVPKLHITLQIISHIIWRFLKLSMCCVMFMSSLSMNLDWIGAREHGTKLLSFKVL